LNNNPRVLAFGKIPALRKYELHMERYRAVFEVLEKYLPSPGPGVQYRILDIGSGDGNLKYFCPQHFEMHGIEKRPNKVEICEKLGYLMKQGDISISPLPYDDQSFDVVVASHIIEHLDHPEQVLSEFYRILRADGILIIGVPMHPCFVSFLIGLRYRYFPYKTPHRQWYCIRTLLALVSRFRFIEVRGFKLFSARRQTNWEDYKGFYNFNTWFGRTFPYLTNEVNITVSKKIENTTDFGN
jgi:SAM-dependent methyltransferase